MIGDRCEVKTVQVRMKVFHLKNQGESFLLDLVVILLATSGIAGCESHRTFTFNRKNMSNYSSEAIRRGVTSQSNG